MRGRIRSWAAPVGVPGPMLREAPYDECLSPELATRLNKTGRHDAIHPLHVGRRGEPDRRLLQRCVAEDRTIVTENARDFRRLIGNENSSWADHCRRLIAKGHGAYSKKRLCF